MPIFLLGVRADGSSQVGDERTLLVVALLASTRRIDVGEREEVGHAECVARRG
jgi:hypothetical protein